MNNNPNNVIMQSDPTHAEGGENNARYSYYCKTMQGGRSENQDACGAGFDAQGNLVATVCDGMGGAAGGATASALSVVNILNYLKEDRPFETGVERVVSAARQANAEVYRHSVADVTLRGMGSTTTIAWFTAQDASVAHVGDSRIYQLRRGQKLFRTDDHSRVFEMVKAGILKNEEAARVHPYSNIIMRALGIRPEVEVEVHRLSYRKGDRFVLCCDGVWNSMPEPELLAILTQEGTPQDIVTRLTACVDQIGRDNGGQHDNLTAIVIDMLADSAYQPSLFERIARLLTIKKK